ncbi:phosphoglycerate mutase family protein [Xenorhabdus kozodoii]|uniref:Phosphoglycerate mutase n=2 Tax=Xenorhabdus kozodoii TaxID=351676 RepID=A0A2D0L5K6_9GAMM|nr:hypothetical protein Xkoz_02959 [Xenorhabdus kozodoii]
MIVLIRHATPKIDYSSCNYQTAQQRLREYNQTQDVEEQEIETFLSSALFQEIKARRPVVYSSPVGRAERTCQLVFGHIDGYTIHSELREVGLEITPLPLLKMKIRTWFLLSRLAWLLRMNHAQEKIGHALQRSEALLPFLEQHDDVAIVSHGYLMHYLKKHLKKNRYHVKDRFKQGCFTAEIWEK